MFSFSALSAAALFFIPAFIIRPFGHQSAWALNLAMALRQRAPLGTLAAALVCVAFALLLWQSATLKRKIFITSILLIIAFSTLMARLNYFEWMFHPIDGPRFDTEAASKLDKEEMILAVSFGGDARAYPISQMAYHHILNDVVAEVPVAVTY